MPAITEQDVLEALKVVSDPDLRRDIVSLGFVKDLKIAGGDVAFTIELTTPACPVKDQMRDEAQAAVAALPGVTDVAVEMTASVRSAVPAETARAPIPGVRNVIAVGAGKGGVGKTTVAVNVAVALARYGGRVGMIDGDVYGPNVPIMLGLDARLSTDGKKIVPARKHGISVVSMGFLADRSAPIIWRGPMLHGVVRQFFQDVAWGELDYLVVDLPPGTGDVHLTLAQSVPMTGAVIVSTPQDVGLQISVKTLRMFEQTKVPILGIIENMAYYICGHCGAKDPIFGEGGARRAASEMGIPFLGEVPLDMAIRSQADLGTPIVVADPEAASSVVLRQISEQLAAQVSIRNYNAPVLEIE